ncbi:MAG TPA: alpha/beta hydrolase, partial [Candidatus Caenarcaniphilales bacterium]
MQLLGQYLHQQGFTIQAIHYPGHDQPVPRMPASTWQQWYNHVLEAYQNLAQEYASVSVIGFSTGCLLSLHLAAAYRLEKLILLCPFLALKRQWYWLLPLEAYVFSIGWLIDDIPR